MHHGKKLGCVVNDDGIKIDPHKVDALARWKTPMNRDLLRGFLSSTGYLADDIDHVRIPKGFPGNKRSCGCVQEPPLQALGLQRRSPAHNMLMGGCLTGIAGVISQGEEWKEGRVAAFFSAKLKPAQQNYPVHEIELFRWYTDHKGLIHLLKQQNLERRIYSLTPSLVSTRTMGRVPCVH